MKLTKLLPLIGACLVALTVASCSSTGDPTPTGPSTTPTTTPVAPAPAAPATPAAPAAPVAASVEITINPNPVPFSGTPITNASGCAGSPNTWFYDQVLRETGGTAVTFTSRVDKFDDRVVNNVTSLSLALAANGTLTINSRWCSAQGVAHTAQTSFSGTDAGGRAITVNGPVVNLRSP